MSVLFARGVLVNAVRRREPILSTRSLVWAGGARIVVGCGTGLPRLLTRLR
jgi:hypothetical protein